MTSVYFDHAATTPVDPRVLEQMLPFFCERYGNPSELHRLGRDARTAVEQARAQVAAGLGAALELALAGMAEARPRLEALRDHLARRVLESVPDVRYLGHPTERLPGNVAFTVRYIEGESMLLQLDTHGFMVSSGSACASSSLEPSHVILALGLGAEEAHGSLRLSLGRENTQAEADAFLEVFPPIVEKLRQMSPLYVKG